MQLIYTTIRFLQGLSEAARRKVVRLVFHTHNLGVPLDNLTRDDYYLDPVQYSNQFSPSGNGH